MSNSVFPEWLQQLPMQQQSVLLLAARGPDGIRKKHPCKAIVRAYRGTVLKAAKYGRELRFHEEADTFMSLCRFQNFGLWREDIDAFLESIDEIPHHYVRHLMHGAEILGYKHPDSRYKERWLEFYGRCVGDAHLELETEATMDKRLSDWDHKYWDVPIAKKPLNYGYTVLEPSKKYTEAERDAIISKHGSLFKLDFQIYDLQSDSYKAPATLMEYDFHFAKLRLSELLRSIHLVYRTSSAQNYPTELQQILRAFQVNTWDYLEKSGQVNSVQASLEVKVDDLSRIPVEAALVISVTIEPCHTGIVTITLRKLDD